jgi:sulfocyanin
MSRSRHTVAHHVLTVRPARRRALSLAVALGASLGLAIPLLAARPAHDAAATDSHLSYDAATKTATLVLRAGEGSANGGMNFNGGSSGSVTITVPQGWTVRWHFVNMDAIPHSAIVLPDRQPFPAIPQTPAIPRAYTAQVTGGIPTNGTDDTQFVASAAGAYIIACGVPGHLSSGMWIRFVVSATATVPTYAP